MQRWMLFSLDNLVTITYTMHNNDGITYMNDNRGPWLLTQSGKKFYLASPEVGDFDVEDAATGLSKTCRFNGQLNPLFEDSIYSVAQHSVYVLWHVRMRGYVREQRWALAHDFLEYPYGDMISPLKTLFPEFSALEARGAALMREQFDIPFDEDIERVVHQSDKALGILESKAITSVPSELWDVPMSLPYDITAIDPDFHCWSPKKARMEFLAAWEEAFA